MTIGLQDFEVIVKALAIVLGAIITYIIRPYIKAKFDETQQNKLENCIKKSIKAMEQIYTPEQWELKKKGVLENAINMLNSGKIKVDITPDELDILIEGLVNEVKKNPENKVVIEQK